MNSTDYWTGRAILFNISNLLEIKSEVCSFHKLLVIYISQVALAVTLGRGKLHLQSTTKELDNFVNFLICWITLVSCQATLKNF